MELLDAGDVMDGVMMDNHSSYERRRIPLETDWINHFLDLNLSKDEMNAILHKIDCEFDGDDVLVPTFRPDLEHKADIAEEIARFYGYNKIPAPASPAARRDATPIRSGLRTRSAIRCSRWA